MKRNFFIGIVIILILAVSVVLYGGYLNYTDSKQIAVRMEERAIQLTGAKVENRNLNPIVPLDTVKLYSENMTDATALIDGRITQIFVTKNSDVRKGDIIFTLENDQIPLKIQQANSNVQRAQSTYSQTLSNVQRAEAALTNATNVYNRQQRLMARNATSQEKLEASQAEYTAAMEAVKAATAESDSARTAIEIAKSELQQYEIQSTRQDVIAPIDGNILLIYKREGAYVQGGTPLALIGNFDTLLFTTTLENADTKYLQIGGIVEIDFNERSFSKAYDTEYSAGNLGKSEKITARIKEINPPPNQSAVMRRVLWEVNNQSHMLEPLTYNNVSIQAGVGHNCLTVPLSAMVDSAHDSVFVVSPEGIIERRTVTVGSDDGEFIEILSGLQLEEIVVIESFKGLEDGVKVEVTIEGETNDRKN